MQHRQLVTVAFPAFFFCLKYGLEGWKYSSPLTRGKPKDSIQHGKDRGAEREKSLFFYKSGTAPRQFIII